MPNSTLFAPSPTPWLLSGLSALLASFYITLNWQQAQNQKTALVTMLVTAEWNIAYGMYLHSTLPDMQIFWFKLHFIGIAFFPAAFFNYSLEFVSIKKKAWGHFLKKTPFLISFALVILAYTNNVHELVWKIPANKAQILILEPNSYGPAMWGFLVYSILIVLVELSLLSLSFFGKTNLHRWQALILSILIVPTGYAILYYPHLIPLSAGFVALLLTISLPKIRENSFLPYSYRIAAKNTPNAVLILNQRDQLLDMNPAAESLFNRSHQEMLRRNIGTIPDLSGFDWNNTGTVQFSTWITALDTPLEYIAQILTLENWLGQPVGKVVSFYQVTETEKLSNALKEKSAELRYNAELQSALAKIVTQMGYTTSSNAALKVMADQLHELDLEFILGVLDEKYEIITIDFLSLDIQTLKSAEKLTNTKMIGYQLPTSVSPFKEVFEKQEVVFDENTFNLTRQLFPHIPEKILRAAYTIAKIPSEEAIMYIPLISQGTPIGVIAIWGNRLKYTNQNTLYIFANQIAVTLENARRYEAEKHANETISRSKSFVIALNSVATTLNENMDLDFFIDSLSKTLNELGFGTFLAFIDEDGQSARLQYGSYIHPLVNTVHKLTGIKLQNYQIERQYWGETATDLFAGKVLYVDNAAEWVSSFIPRLSPKLLEKALINVGQRSKDKIILLPLITSKKTLGALGIWGEHIQREDVPTLKVFANQISSILQNAHLYKLEQERSEELARSKAFTSALGAVAATIGQTQDSAHILRVLGEELGALGLGNLIARMSRDQASVTIDTISTSMQILEMIKRLSGVDLRNYKIPRKYWEKLADEYFFQGKSVFVEDPLTFTSQLIPRLPKTILASALELTQGHTNDKSAYLPLRVNQEAYGILGVWGTELRKEDLPALEVFANQVSASIKSAETLEEEREENSRVARANNFISALSQVASQLGTTSNPDKMLDILNVELSKLGITFMLTTLREDGETLVLRYTSIEKKLLEWAEKIAHRKAIDFPFSKKDFPAWSEIIDQKKSIVIEDALEATLKGLSSATKISTRRLEVGVKSLFKHADWDFISVWHPLLVENKVTGTINFWGKTLQKDDLTVLTIFANQVASSLRNARLYEEGQQHNRNLEISLAEKNVLLKEVHHRVKNNLQIISSLLNLQAAKINNQEILGMFSESRDRIYSMALVHEKLYQSNDLAQIDFSEYIRGLSTQLMQTYAAHNKNIELELDIQNIHLSIDQAVPCGLMVNEIITNSIKHAFPERQKGKISITLHKEPNNRIKLVVQDNGIGIPDQITLNNPDTLGMQIISLLTTQVGGKVKLHRQQGSAIEITF